MLLNLLVVHEILCFLSKLGELCDQRSLPDTARKLLDLNSKLIELASNWMGVDPIKFVFHLKLHAVQKILFSILR